LHRPHQPDVVATVNGHPIDQATLDATYRSNSANGPQKPSQVQSPDSLTSKFCAILSTMNQAAARRQLNLSNDEEYRLKLAEIKAPFTQGGISPPASKRKTCRSLSEAGHSRGLTNEKLMNREIFSKINITDADIQVLQPNKSLFNLVEPESMWRRSSSLHSRRRTPATCKRQRHTMRRRRRRSRRCIPG